MSDSEVDAKQLKLQILAQPNDVTCGPTCLHSVYSYFNDDIGLGQVIEEVKQFATGGTLAVMLGNHALSRGYRATIYTYNVHMFDPTWFSSKVDLRQKLIEQRELKSDERIQSYTQSYLQFLEQGGKIKFEELSSALIRRFLNKNIPVLTGLSATYLYHSAREIPETNAYDDLRGEPSGHFVVLYAYDKTKREITIADPLDPNPISDRVQYYTVNTQRLINAIMLGIVTYDANLLIIEPQ
ncbi:peptidase-C39 like family protein [Reichenbachiella sp. 5M10]|uniref:peptidase-C39 like family protein n=1 Tax=Reichenbachiella sp. 5M10 TaxID=1889772 RepID=UPI000C1551F9|nr:peptidase-C39 like family protein [Reichenbachiella sp. 5M10]PIB36252.1 peptidase-C39 like family protein [Reichenbachiella sp. 5M10]